MAQTKLEQEVIPQRDYILQIANELNAGNITTEEQRRTALDNLMKIRKDMNARLHYLRPRTAGEKLVSNTLYGAQIASLKLERMEL